VGSEIIQCAAEAHAAVHAVARAADRDERIVATDALGPDDGRLGRWSLEVTLKPRAGGCPPALLREVAARELTVRDVSPQETYWRVVVTA
jgi:uncharacterized protein YndB with AHSA1/START domain